MVVSDNRVIGMTLVSLWGSLKLGRHIDVIVIIAIRKTVPQKAGARTIDCAMNYCIIVW